MANIYARLKNRAREVASRFPLPDFYRKFEAAHHRSLTFFNTDTVVADVAHHVNTHIEDDFGHGRYHVREVSLDAGALMMIEGEKAGYGDRKIKLRLRMVQCAGLLHDIMRKQKNHAAAGAEYAHTFLADYPFSSEEVSDICHAIRNHEAFKKNSVSKSFETELISACLYDADKFRWGPDNFKHTLWDMVSFADISLKEFMSHYPGGMEKLANIRSTFRTETGKRYGPQIIDTGIAIGERMYDIIRAEYPDDL